MDAGDRRHEEEEWAHSWAQALASHGSAQPSSAAQQAGADLLSVLNLLERITGDQAVMETNDAQRKAAPPQQPHSAFHAFGQQHGQWNPQQQPQQQQQQQQQSEPAEAEPVHKHLEAMSFWIQVKAS
jgi:hypothetical protein